MNLTTVLATKLFIFIMAFLAPSKYDVKYENPDDRKARMEIVAESVATAAHKATCTEQYKTPGCKRLYGGSPEMLAMIVLKFGYQESNLAEYVHSNRCGKPDDELYEKFKFRCDSYYNKKRELKHRAIGLWQLHASSGFLPQEIWEKMGEPTLESTELQVLYATKRIAGLVNAVGLENSFKVYNNRPRDSKWITATRNANWVNVNVGKLY